MHEVWLIGSGSLAASIALALTDVAQRPTRVTMIARDAQALNDLSYIVRARAALTKRPIVFSGQQSSLDSVESLAAAAGESPPDVVLNCASLHSPWEHRTQPSEWTALTREAGLGMTLPMQVAIAARAASALASVAPGAVYLNASFPDAVNPVLRALELPVFAGIGNVGLIAASLQTGLRLEDQNRLQVLAHHWHLTTPDSPADEARAWLDGVEVADVGGLLRTQRETTRHLLNHVTGYTAAILIRDLGRDERFTAHLPGVAGLPGGYPVTVAGATAALRPPAGYSEDDMRVWNDAFSERDGVKVAGDGAISFSPHVQEVLARHLPDVARGFDVTDVEDACQELLNLRDRLRQRPPPPDPDQRIR